MHGAAVGGVHGFELHGFTALFYLLHPGLGTIAEALGALLFIVGYIDVYPGIFIALVFKRVAGEKLHGAHVFAFLANEKAVQVGGWHVELDNVVLGGGVDVGIEPKKRQ